MRTKASLYAILMLAMALGVLAGCSRKPIPTDAQITVEIQSKLYSDSAIQSRQIEVQAANGVVTLSGEVGTDAERVAAAGDAATVEGVKTVVNNLQVQQAEVSSPGPPYRRVAPKPSPAGSSKLYRSESDRASRRNASESDAENAGADALVADDTPSEASSEQTPQTPPPPPAPPKKVTLPAGTQLTIRLDNPLDSERNQVGDAFHGSLSNPIVQIGRAHV